MPLHELRLTLPDEPGSLAQVADVIGRHGGNILSFEAIESAEGVAVDDLVLDLDPGSVDRVRSSLDALADVQVETLSPVPQRPLFDGPLELIEALVHAADTQVPQTLVDGLPEAMRASWAAVLADRSPQPRRIAASVGAPSLVGMSTPWLPLTGARLLALDGWTPVRWGLDTERASVAAAPLDDDGVVALLAVRRYGPTFRHREVRVLGGLGLIAGRLMRDDPDL